MANLSGRNLVIAIIVASLLLMVVGFQLRGPLPEIVVPAETLFHPLGFPLTNTVISAWVTILVLLFLFRRATGFSFEKMALVPSRMQNLMETVVETMWNFVVSVAGERDGRRFFPLVMTIFLFVIANAWLSLLPGFGIIGLVEAKDHGHTFQETNLGSLRIAILPPGAQGGEGEDVHKETPEKETQGLKGTLIPIFRGANTDLNTTLGLALTAMLFVEMWGIQANGFFGYTGRFINVGRLLRGQILPGLLDLFVGLLETVSEFARVISFTFRLFGNMFAGEVLLAVMVFLIPWVVVIPFYGLEIFVGFVQALVFAALTLVFISMAVAQHGDEHESAGGEHAGH